MNRLRDVLAQQEPSLHQSLLASWEIAEHDWIPTLRMEGESHAGAPHLHSVEEWMDRLAEACRSRWSKHSSSPFGLNAMEIYILLASALFHDIGRGHPRGQKDQPPHGTWSRRIVGEHWAQLGIVNARIAHEIGLICEYHTDPALKWHHHDVTLIHPWGMVHTEALAAVLTLADELDTAYTRAVPPYMKDKELGLETGETIQPEVLDRMEEELFTKGLYRESIGSVEMDPGSHLIKTVLFAHRLPGPLEEAKPDSAAANWVKRHTRSGSVPKDFELDDFFFSYLDVLANAKTGDPRAFLARQYYRAKDMRHMALLNNLRLPAGSELVDDLERHTVLWSREAPVVRPAMVTATLRAGSDLETSLELIERTVKETGTSLDTKGRVEVNPKGALLAANILEGVATSLWAAQQCRETVLRESTLGTEAANERLRKYATKPKEAYTEMLRGLHEAVPVPGDYSQPEFREAPWWKQDCWRMVDAASAFLRAGEGAEDFAGRLKGDARQLPGLARKVTFRTRKWHSEHQTLAEEVKKLAGEVEKLAGEVEKLADKAEEELATKAKELADRVWALADKLRDAPVNGRHLGTELGYLSARIDERLRRRSGGTKPLATDTAALSGTDFHSSLLVLMHALTFLEMDSKDLRKLCGKGALANLWQTLAKQAGPNGKASEPSIPAMQVHLEARTIEQYHANLSQAFQFYLRCVRPVLGLPLFDSRALATTEKLAGARAFLKELQEDLGPKEAGDGGPQDKDAARKSRETAFAGLKRSVDKVVSLWRRRHRQDGGILAPDLQFAIRFMLMQWLSGDVSTKHGKLVRLQAGLRKLDIPFTDWMIEYSNQLFDDQWRVRIEPSFRPDKLDLMLRAATKLWDRVQTSDKQLPWESLAAEVREPSMAVVRTVANRLDNLLFLHAGKDRWSTEGRENAKPHFWHFMAAQQSWHDATNGTGEPPLRIETGSSGWSLGEGARPPTRDEAALKEIRTFLRTLGGEDESRRS